MLASVEYWTKMTGLGTFALAAVTLVILIPTVIGIWLASNAAREDLRATKEAATAARESAEQQIMASYRPLLIDIALDAPVPTDITVQHQRADPGQTSSASSFVTVVLGEEGTVRVDPRRPLVHLSPGRLQIMVPLRNVGRGLAVIDGVGMASGKGVGKTLATMVTRKRIPPGETTRVVVGAELLPRQQQQTLGPYVIHVSYRDYMGQQPTIAVVQIDQMDNDDTDISEWQVGDVRQSLELEDHETSPVTN